MFAFLAVQPPGLRLAKVKTDGTYTAPCRTSVLFPQDGGNLHCFTARTSCAVLDVLGPPYSNPEEGRDCTYYNDSPYASFCGTIINTCMSTAQTFIWSIWHVRVLTSERHPPRKNCLGGILWHHLCNDSYLQTLGRVEGTDHYFETLVVWWLLLLSRRNVLEMFVLGSRRIHVLLSGKPICHSGIVHGMSTPDIMKSSGVDW